MKIKIIRQKNIDIILPLLIFCAGCESGRTSTGLIVSNKCTSTTPAMQFSPSAESINLSTTPVHYRDGQIIPCVGTAIGDVYVLPDGGCYGGQGACGVHWSSGATSYFGTTISALSPIHLVSPGSPATKSPSKAIVAVIARCSLESTEAQRTYTRLLSDQLRAKLAADKTLTTLPGGVNDDFLSGWQIPGFVTGTDELHKTADRLPNDCNVIIVVGPYPENSGWFPVSIMQRGNFAAMHASFGPPTDNSPTSDVVNSEFVMIRQDIDTIVQQSE